MIRSNALRGSRETACKQNLGNFHFSASRASVRMKVIPLELYELAVFYGIIATMLGVLLKIHVWPPQYHFWVLHNGIKARFKMILIMHFGPGTGLQRQIMQQIIILPTLPWYKRWQMRVEPSHRGLLITMQPLNRWERHLGKNQWQMN